MPLLPPPLCIPNEWIPVLKDHGFYHSCNWLVYHCKKCDEILKHRSEIPNIFEKWRILKSYYDNDDNYKLHELFHQAADDTIANDEIEMNDEWKKVFVSAANKRMQRMKETRNNESHDRKKINNPEFRFGESLPKNSRRGRRRKQGRTFSLSGQPINKNNGKVDVNTRTHHYRQFLKRSYDLESANSFFLIEMLMDAKCQKTNSVTFQEFNS